MGVVISRARSHAFAGEIGRSEAFVTISIFSELIMTFPQNNDPSEIVA
jgi:hypothetical protein